MKYILIMLFCTASLLADNNQTAVVTPTPQKPVQQSNDGLDTTDKVVLQNFAAIAQGLGMAGGNPGLAQMFVAFVNILIEVFKVAPIRGEPTHENIMQWLDELPQDTRLKLITLLAECAKRHPSVTH